ncbi:MAG: hypothetical protein SWE60_11380 [Thermodesulfobacteriota bacterium]|nr:hypothetical protein [Thermodesulfobacteriota bacterium]
MYLKAAMLAVVVVALVVLPGLVSASPPVPPPTEGFAITTAVDCEMSAGDFSEVEFFTWTWVHDPFIVIVGAPNLNDNHVGKPLLRSTLAFPGTDQHLGSYGRAAQIRYTEEMQSTDTSFLQFKKGFAAGSENDPNVSVDRNYGYVASEASLIANAENKERVGLSIVANGDALPRITDLGNGNGLRLLGQGLGDMPSLCPWAHGAEIPATNEFIAMGSDTATTSVMVSDTDTSVVATRAPEMDHSISAVGTGMAQGLMKVALMEGGRAYVPEIDVAPPDLVSETDYSEKTRSLGTMEKFSKAMHYHSTIPAYQMPEPWYELQ